MKRKFLDYPLDFLYATFRFPNGFTKPYAFIGYFNGNVYGDIQKIFFKTLLDEGFRRTPFQLIFPNQIAGLIKIIKNNNQREYHVRFYNDGIIDCEEEVKRFNPLHYSGHRTHKLDLLEEILEKSNINNEHKKQITQLFKEKSYSEKCVRKT